MAIDYQVALEILRALLDDARRVIKKYTSLKNEFTDQLSRIEETVAGADQDANRAETALAGVRELLSRLGIEHQWQGTYLRLRGPDDWGPFINLIGETGPQGEQGPRGERGERGETGAQGASTHIRGSLDNPTLLPIGGEPGDLYLMDGNGYGYAAGDGYAWDETRWVNVGKIRGPVGKQGPRGDQGIQGLRGLTGDQGPKGEKGDQGIPGIKGDKGDIGLTGERGLQGEQGPKGDQGVAGTDGLDGADGAPGQKGDKGDRGETGPKGDQGLQGIQGQKGDKGDIGLTGAKGDQGIQGVPGTNGANGLDGAKGDKGDQGVQGERGLQGYDGPKGDKGDIGLTGPKGDKGDIGLTGAKGDQGIQGIPGNDGATGAKGDKGDMGPQGIPGVKGDQGPQGVQGAKGDQGIQGVKGDTGAKGDQGIQGIQGIQGLQGAKGDKGDQGIQGPAGTVGTPEEFEIRSDTFDPKLLFVGSGSGTWNRISGNGPIVLLPQGSDEASRPAMYVMDGRVGINQPGASYTLDVNGSFHATGTVIPGASSGSLSEGNLKGPLRIDGAGSGSDSIMSFHKPGEFGVNFGIGSDNQLRVGGWSMGDGTNYLLWTEYNSPGQFSNGDPFFIRQKLPSGGIILLGSQGLGVDSNGSGFLAFPVAFPNKCRYAVGSIGDFNSNPANGVQFVDADSGGGIWVNVPGVRTPDAGIRLNYIAFGW